MLKAVERHTDQKWVLLYVRRWLTAPVAAAGRHSGREGSGNPAGVVDLDIRAFFDSVPHDLLLKAVAHHTNERWILLYIERWLKAPIQREDGTLEQRDCGTPQGSAISPLLANLFMHYAFECATNEEAGGW